MANGNNGNNGNNDLEVKKSSKTCDENENKQTQCPISIVILILFLPEEEFIYREPSNTTTCST
jgi:hypothetical protein